MPPHAIVQHVLTGMTEGRVTEVVGQRHRLDKILVQTQAAGDGAAELGHFQRVGQPRTEQVTFVIEEDLGLVDEAAERSTVDDAVAVTLEFTARRRGRLGDAAPATALGVGRVGCTLSGHQAAPCADRV